MPRSRRQRNADIKLLAIATFGVLLAGLFLASVVYVATRGDEEPTCGELRFDAADVRDRLETAGPELRTGGGGCSFWLALEEGDIVAYKVNAPGSDCVVQYKSQFECGGEAVDVTTLARYPTTIVTGETTDELVIDLRPSEATSTTS